jgi:hypothetical protein
MIVSDTACHFIRIIFFVVSTSNSPKAALMPAADLFLSGFVCYVQALGIFFKYAQFMNLLEFNLTNLYAFFMGSSVYFLISFDIENSVLFYRSFPGSASDASKPACFRWQQFYGSI